MEGGGVVIRPAFQPRFGGPRPRFGVPRFQGHHHSGGPMHGGPGAAGGDDSSGHGYGKGQMSMMGGGAMFDGKRVRNKCILRKTVDYNASIVTYLENRLWQRDFRDHRPIPADELYICHMLPPPDTVAKPMNCVSTRFVRNSTNKIRCPIFCVCWTPEGRRLITGASSGEFTLWNGLTFNFETILQAHDSSVRAMVWSHNDQWMLTADHGGFVKYWQSNMNNVKMYQAHKEAIRGLSFCPTDVKFASCSDDGTVRIWDFMRCYEEKILRGHGADVKCVDWHPQKSLVASGSKDTQQPLKLWDPRMGESLATIHAHKHTVMEVKWNRNGNWLLTASRDHLLKIFDIRNFKEEMQSFKGHKKEAMTVAWHPIHESLFTSGGSDGGILFWLVGNEKEVGSIDEAHDTMVWSLAWHPLGHILVSGSNDHSTKFWTRNRPGDSMRDKYNLNTLPMGMTEDMLEHEGEMGGAGALPGMGLEYGLPDHLKKPVKEEVVKVEEPVIPGLDFSMPGYGGGPGHLPRKKIPYAKPVPKDFQQAWSTGKQPVGLTGGGGKEEESQGQGQDQDNRANKQQNGTGQAPGPMGGPMGGMTEQQAMLGLMALGGLAQGFPMGPLSVQNMRPPPGDPQNGPQGGPNVRPGAPNLGPQQGNPNNVGPNMGQRPPGPNMGAQGMKPSGGPNMGPGPNQGRGRPNQGGQGQGGPYMRPGEPQRPGGPNIPSLLDVSKQPGPGGGGRGGGGGGGGGGRGGGGGGGGGPPSGSQQGPGPSMGPIPQGSRGPAGGPGPRPPGPGAPKPALLPTPGEEPPRVPGGPNPGGQGQPLGRGQGGRGGGPMRNVFSERQGQFERSDEPSAAHNMNTGSQERDVNSDAWGPGANDQDLTFNDRRGHPGRGGHQGHWEEGAEGPGWNRGRGRGEEWEQRRGRGGRGRGEWGGEGRGVPDRRGEYPEAPGEPRDGRRVPLLETPGPSQQFGNGAGQNPEGGESWGPRPEYDRGRDLGDMDADPRFEGSEEQRPAKFARRDDSPTDYRGRGRGRGGGRGAPFGPRGGGPPPGARGGGPGRGVRGSWRGSRGR